jgi:excisionase family DNA binding protein
MPETEFWSSKEVCEYLGISLNTLRYWQYMGTGPRSYRMGRHRKYKPADVRAWAERRVEEPESTIPSARYSTRSDS